MEYIAYTKDGGQYLFAAGALETVKHAMKTGQVVDFKDGAVQGSSISRYGRNQSAGPANTSQLQLDAGDVFSQSPVPGFWQQILRLNQARKDQSTLLPWLYAPFIEECRTLSGITDPLELFAFITAEWDNLPVALNICSLIKRTSHT